MKKALAFAGLLLFILLLLVSCGTEVEKSVLPTTLTEPKTTERQTEEPAKEKQTTETGVATVTTQKPAPAVDPASADFVFEPYGSGYAVTAYHGTDKTVTIPATYNGKNVVAIGTGKRDGERYIADGLAKSYDVQTIIIPETVREINHGAFQYCVSLKEIHIPNVVKIGRGAFMYCTNLTKITIDGGILEKYTFEGCDTVKEIVLGNQVTGIQSELLNECRALECLTLATTGTITFPQLFAKLGFSYSGSLEPISLTSGAYSGQNIGGTTLIYTKPASNNSGWLLPGVGWYSYKGYEVLWDGEKAASVSNYVTCGYAGDTWKEPTEGYFYGYTVPKTLKAVTFTEECGAAGKYESLPSSIQVRYPSHTWGAWTVTTAPTCGATGTETHTCTKCGAKETRSVEKLPHTYSAAWSSNDTQHWHDATCGHTETSGKANHTWGAWETVQGNDCEAGIREHTCIVCGKTVQEQTEPLLTLNLSNDGTYYTVTSCLKTATNVVVPNSYKGIPISAISQGAFNGCYLLESLTIPFVGAGTGKIANSNHFGYIFGTDSYVGGTETHSDNSSYSATYHVPKALKSVMVTGGEIPYCAFNTCSGLTSVTIGNGVTSIGSYAFFRCAGLRSVTIPDSVTSIGNDAFRDCTGLTSVTIGNSVTSIGSSAFGGCTGLTSVTIPDSVTSIGSSAFGGCTGLTSVTIPDSVTSIGNWAFSGCTGLTNITIPDSVTNIGDSAFSGCRHLTSVTIPDSVTSIGDRAFFECSRLTSVMIGNDVTSIGDSAFSYCGSLTSVTFSNASGWYLTTAAGANSGINMDVSDASTNATNLKSDYSDCYWYRK